MFVPATPFVVSYENICKTESFGIYSSTVCTTYILYHLDLVSFQVSSPKLIELWRPYKPLDYFKHLLKQQLTLELKGLFTKSSLHVAML